jgi:hypothetical protein
MYADVESKLYFLHGSNTSLSLVFRWIIVLHDFSGYLRSRIGSGQVDD